MVQVYGTGLVPIAFISSNVLDIWYKMISGLVPTTDFYSILYINYFVGLTRPKSVESTTLNLPGKLT